MNTDPAHSTPIDSHPELFALAHEIHDIAKGMLNEFNRHQKKLFDLSPGQRIFLFILTRAMKTYSSILVLCQSGFGQDVAVLIRGLLENLVTAKYILRDKKKSNDLAERFVAYKWIIFKRNLAEQERSLDAANVTEQNEFNQRKELILRHVEEFKKKFKVTSDRGLLTWSGKTVRDMAKEISRELLEEYDSTFRMCSRFSHPSILGDQEYMIQDEKNLIFSPLPSPIGVSINLKHAIGYFLEFLDLVEQQFLSSQDSPLKNLKTKFSSIWQNISQVQQPPPTPSSAHQSPIRECTIVFKTSS